MEGSQIVLPARQQVTVLNRRRLEYSALQHGQLVPPPSLHNLSSQRRRLWNLLFAANSPAKFAESSTLIGQ
jgi:hypothetical protein